MTDPAITAALEALIATTPPPVTVWGVRYTAGHVEWALGEAEARKWLAEDRAKGRSAELVHVTGRVHVEG